MTETENNPIPGPLVKTKSSDEPHPRRVKHPQKSYNKSKESRKMARIEFKLDTGLTIGKDDTSRVHFDVVLIEPTAGHIIEAQEESEKMVYQVKGEKIEPALVISPTAMGMNVLRRQIVQIGDIKGPMDINILKKLSANDFSLIQQKADELDNASMELVDRGRDGADSRDA